MPIAPRPQREIRRFSHKGGGGLVTLNACCNDEEKERMDARNLTARTIMSVDEWVAFFKEADYTGDYDWFIP